MTRFAIALGSNMGDRQWHLRSAVKELSDLAAVLAVSGLYETAPIGGPEQDPFLNAVVAIETDLDPLVLLAKLQAIEAGHDRQRAERWGPRTLDLDIVASDGPAIDLVDLTVPHPRAAERRFVIEPLADVWPNAPVGDHVTAAEALDSLLGQEMDLLNTDWVDQPERPPGRYWVLGQLVLFAVIGVSLIVDGVLPPPWRVLTVAGVVIALLGLLVITASAVALGSNLTALPEPLLGGDLVRSGPYGLVRHPMYSGVILLFLGTSLFVGSVVALVLVAALFVYFAMKSKYEEVQLRISYPGYMAYRRDVRFRFAPPLI
jgi:2-amino-4-hydroxy-6-hydroxymethyldihydropteridine diphosphokinase